MAEGAPDWHQIIMLRGVDAAGDLHEVRVDDGGRIWMLAYGYTGGVYVPLRVDNLGRMIALMTGYDGADYHTIRTDLLGRMLALIYDPATGKHLGIDADGFGTMVVKGHDGAALHTLRTDTLGRLTALFRDPTSDNYAAISNDGYLGAILRGGSDIRLGLLLWARIREPEGTTIQDYSGNNHEGTARSGGVAAAVYRDGVLGESLYLDGINDDIDFTNHAGFDFTSGSFTVEFWLKPDTLVGTKALVIRGLRDTDGWEIWGMSSLKLRFVSNQAADNQPVYSQAVLVVGSWQHCCIVRSEDTITFYRNGIDVTGDPVAITDPLMSARVLYIGRHDAGSSWFQGNIDDIRIYSRNLSAEEVLWRFNRTHVSLDERYRPLSVDPEGRLEVSITDFAYKDQVLERGSTVYGGGGAQNEQSAVVPAGKMWVITAASAHSNGSACTSIDIGIYDGVDNFIIASQITGGNVFEVHYQGQLILKPGDRLNFGWGHDGTAYTTDWTLNGYELDYPY